MTPQAHVAVYGVDETGATSVPLGSGTLIAPQLVLVHPPLSRQLASGENTKRLRVEITVAGSDPGTAEVIDVVEVHVAAADLSAEPLVALQLQQLSDAPFELLFCRDDDIGPTVELMVWYLASLP